MPRDCCMGGAKRQCQRTDRQDIVIILGGKEVKRVPCFCFLKKLGKVVNPEKSYETCIPGLRFLSGMAEAGRLDLNKFKADGTVPVAQTIAGVFGGEISKFLYPPEEEGRRIPNVRPLREVLEDNEDLLEEEFEEQKEAAAN